MDACDASASNTARHVRQGTPERLAGSMPCKKLSGEALLYSLALETGLATLVSLRRTGRGDVDTAWRLGAQMWQAGRKGGIEEDKSGGKLAGDQKHSNGG